MTTLAAELVTTEAGLCGLAPEWEALWQRARAGSPFQSPAWLLPWWRHFGSGMPVVALLRDGEELLGILAAYVLIEGSQRKLLPMGAGLADYVDALLAPDAPGDAGSRLLATAIGGAGDITSCDLVDLPPEAALRLAAAPPGWRRDVAAAAPCPVLALPPELDGLQRAIPARTRRKLRMNRNRAERAGGWTTQVADAASLPELLTALIDLHGASWAVRGEAGVLVDPSVLAFHRAAAPRLLAAGILRLQVLRFGGAIAAACLALLARPDRLLLYLGGFDPACGERSPGSLLMGEMIEAATLEGIGELHFLRGGEAYKYAWGATDRHNAVCRFVPA